MMYGFIDKYYKTSRRWIIKLIFSTELEYFGALL